MVTCKNIAECSEYFLVPIVLEPCIRLTGANKHPLKPTLSLCLGDLSWLYQESSLWHSLFLHSPLLPSYSWLVCARFPWLPFHDFNHTASLSSLHSRLPSWAPFIHPTAWISYTSHPNLKHCLSRLMPFFPPTDLHFPVLPLSVKAKVHVARQSRAPIFLCSHFLNCRL